MRSRTFRPKALLPAMIALVLILSALPACVTVPVQTAIPPSPPSLDVQERALLDAINLQRLGGGLAALMADAQLTLIARERSAEMVSQNYFGHTGPQGDTRYLTLLAQDAVAYAIAGEILAFNCCWLPDSAAAAMSSFLSSPAHHELLMRPAFTRVGVGMGTGTDGRKIYTVVFTG